MRAAVCREYGPPSVVRVEDDHPAPELTPGGVRVRVHAAAVNFPDVLIVANRYQVSAALPFVVGSEFAGVVGEVADGVTSVAVGDRVAGTGFIGAFAEEAVVGEGAITPIPEGVDDRIAAGFGVAFRTAYHVLRSTARLQPGDDLIVLGAGGGVGLAAVQIGAAIGATVTAVASSDEKLAVAARYGATHLVNRRAGDLRSALKDALPRGAEVVVDPVGGECSEPALRALHYGGRFVTVGFAAGEIPRIPLNLVLLKGVHVLGFEMLSFLTHHPDDLERNERELLGLLAAGKVTPHVGATFALDETAAALELVAQGDAIGKVVIDL